mmetsp:Transcript_22859/g.28170  ORF Transcript_22859/g.28170 Transcript_22859/m.28170 type:complete len:84 (+) Transcript_22859:296-547(+)
MACLEMHRHHPHYCHVDNDDISNVEGVCTAYSSGIAVVSTLFLAHDGASPPTRVILSSDRIMAYRRCYEGYYHVTGLKCHASI